jgi:hypothetical protein
MKKELKKTSHRTCRRWLRQQRHKLIDRLDAAAECRYIIKNTTRRPIEEYDEEDLLDVED